MRRVVLALLGLGVVGLTPGAHAAIVDVTYTGIVAESYDSTLFGAITDGTAYTAFYVFNTGVADDKLRNSDRIDDDGGTEYGVPSPNIFARFTIEGKTKSESFAGSYAAETYAYNIVGETEQYHIASTPTTYLENYIFNYSNSLPATIDESFQYDIMPDDKGSGEYFNTATGDRIFLLPQHLSETVVSAVPLPASAPLFAAALMLLAGFGVGLKRWVAPQGKAAA